MTRSSIQVGIAKTGSCASAPVWSVHYDIPEYRCDGIMDLMHASIGGYLPSDIKVDADAHDAACSEPNCTSVLRTNIAEADMAVRLEQVLDGSDMIQACTPFLQDGFDDADQMVEAFIQTWAAMSHPALHTPAVS